VLAKRYAQFANMTLFSKLPKINSKTQFLKTIKGGYLRLTNGCVPEYLLNAVSKAITDYYYDQYRRFRKQYPKSVKRYSTFSNQGFEPSNHLRDHHQSVEGKGGEGLRQICTPILEYDIG
jgi:hypothetical protein